MSTDMPAATRKPGKRLAFRLPAEGSDVTTDDLRHLTNALINEVQRLLRRCVDADIMFVPADPYAHDTAAASGDEAAMAWTLGHIIAHTTASSEESATLASELARGVPYHGRSRSEIPWQLITTVAQCHMRLEESRRMRLASLDMWPYSPHLDNVYVPWEGALPMGPIERFLSGLRHDADHLDQVRDVIRQARASRRRKTLWGGWRRR